MVHLLSIYGDPESLITQFEAELGRKQKQIDKSKLPQQMDDELPDQ